MKAILTYHSVDPSGSVISIDPRTFAAHVRWLAENVTVLPLEQLMSTAHQNAVAITFDDGFQNFADAALPLLSAHGLPATVFVATDHVGTTNAWSVGATPMVPQLPLMDWTDLERIKKHGISIGSHTRTHPDLRRQSADEKSTEIAGAAEILTRRLGERPRTFAYPFGEFDDRAVATVRDTYAYACTTELRALNDDEDEALLPRLDAYYFRREGLLEQFGTGAFRRFIWVRRHGRAVRRVLAHAGGRA